MEASQPKRAANRKEKSASFPEDAAYRLVQLFIRDEEKYNERRTGGSNKGKQARQICLEKWQEELAAMGCHRTTEQRLHVHKDALIYFNFPSSTFSVEFLEWAISLETGMFSATLAVLAVQFSYRYWAVFDTKKLVYFESYRYLFFVTYILVIGFGWAVTVRYFFDLGEYGREHLAQVMFKSYELDVSDIPILSAIAYQNNTFRLETIYGILLDTVMFISQYAIICFCAHKMYKEMNEKISLLSSDYQRIHRQFFKTLIIQRLHVYNDALIYFNFSNPTFSNEFLEYVIALETGMFSATISILAIHFLYRYWAIFNTKKLVYFEGYRYLFFISYFILFGLGWSFTDVYFYDLGDYGREHLARVILENYELNVADIPVMSAIAYQNGGVRWETIYGILLNTLMLMSQYFIICYCAHRMYKEMNEKISIMSLDYQRIHRQFFKALVIQTLTPTIILFGPASFLIYVPYANLNISLPSTIFVSFFTVYPAVDSICVMCCVSEYRKCFQKSIQSVKSSMKRSKSNVIPGINQHSTATELLRF
ncbi:hypothetical protein CAEBREN_00819 [Caenorhabditis brenneri]|uniref:Uncharacterized protein n=1 Tax=Caenorhabditis brenneri TaxID=135651 RepID=G0P0J9_CAEBE|nr:hypothetical protein CAEBREN_00819 [Caenorhabditis brenneri]